LTLIFVLASSRAIVFAKETRPSLQKASADSPEESTRAASEAVLMA
jgi:hypothetical protein